MPPDTTAAVRWEVVYLTGGWSQWGQYGWAVVRNGLVIESGFWTASAAAAALRRLREAYDRVHS